MGLLLNENTMFSKKNFFVIAFAAMILLAGQSCVPASQNADAPNGNEDAMMEEKDDAMMEAKDDSMMEDDGDEMMEEKDDAMMEDGDSMMEEKDDAMMEEGDHMENK